MLETYSYAFPLNGQFASMLVQVSTMCGSTGADTQAGERFIAETENAEAVRGFLGFVGIGLNSYLSWCHVCSCRPGTICLLGLTGLFSIAGIQNSRPYKILDIKKVCARVAEARRADRLPTFLFTRASQRRRSSQTIPEIVRSLYAQ